MGSLRGLIYVYSDTPRYPADELFRSLFGGGFRRAVPSSNFIVFALAVPLVWFYLNHTVSGRAAYAIGVNEEAVRLAGINVRRHLIAAYVACGFLAALAGVLLASRLGIAQPSVGVGYELDAIAAVVIGGGILGGGGGTVLGVLGGVLALAMVDNVLNLFNVEFLLPAVPEGPDHPGRGAGQAKEDLKADCGLAVPAHSKGGWRCDIFVRLKMAMLAGFACGVLGAMPVSAQDKEIKIGVVNLSLCCAYFVGMDAAVKDEAKPFSNVKVLSTDAKGDVAKLTAERRGPAQPEC